jgi:hypothetical protein
MYTDDEDFYGLGYWYNDAQEYIKQIKNSLGTLQ